MTKDETLKLTLEFANDIQRGKYKGNAETIIATIKSALEAKDEPVAWMYPDDLKRFETSETFAQAYSIEVVSPTHGETVPLYTTPPQRKPLSFEQVEDCFPDEAIFSEQDGWLRVSAQTLHDIARNVEAAHGITGDNNG